jgi:molecular chaperone GrpE
MRNSRETDPADTTPGHPADPSDARPAEASGPRGRDPGEAPPRPEAAEAGRDNGELIAELAQIEDRYRRALADLDNYRKRAARELDRRVTEVRDSMMRDWLETVDSVERAIQMQPDGPCADGLRAVLEQMDVVLRRHGASRIAATGAPFDPERHEAIAVQPTRDAPAGTVLGTERSGYQAGDRVIRPAQVVVARAPERAD